MITEALSPKRLTTPPESDTLAPEENSPEAIYRRAAPERITFNDATLALRRFGSTGKPLVFIHGFPVHGYTWRKLLPELSRHNQCLVLDLPGLGDSDWHNQTDFRFTAQARRLSMLLEKLGRRKTTLIAHDTGATIARLVALQCPELVDQLILINTEIPGHRPPWIRLHQLSSRLPLAGAMFRLLLQSKQFLHSSMGFQSFYADREILAQCGMLAPYVLPLTESTKRMQGMFGYLRGIEWDVLDALATQHRDIRARTHLIWGEQDATFPLRFAERMREQFNPAASLSCIRNAALMPHEEQPEQVLNAIQNILESH